MMTTGHYCISRSEQTQLSLVARVRLQSRSLGGGVDGRGLLPVASSTSDNNRHCDPKVPNRNVAGDDVESSDRSVWSVLVSH